MPVRHRDRTMDGWDSDDVAAFKLEAVDVTQEERVGTRGLDFRRPVELVAEGDSWFDYTPGTDVIDCLRRYHGYRIHTFANAGDTLENMIYGTGVDRTFQRTSPSIERVLYKVGQVKPVALLFSGGGNDIAGDGFESFLNHRASGLSPFRRTFATDMIHVVFRKYYADLVAKVRRASPRTTVVTHGYAHTLPTGEGVDFLFLRFAGPWLRPSLARKGIFDPDEQNGIVVELIDAFNEMLADLAASTEGLVHVDLREEIDRYSDWANELHLKNSAYRIVAEMFDEVITDLDVQPGSR